jgi:hypothetical protein
VKVCSIEGCSKKNWARGFCQTHYRKLRANGTLVKLNEQQFRSDNLRPIKLSEPAYQNILAWFKVLPGPKRKQAA